VSRLRAGNAGLQETYRDLGLEPPPHLSGAYLGAAQNPAAEYPASVKADLALGNTLLQEFLAADIVVIGVAVYNFSVSSALKAWIDRVLVVGRTFKYGADGRPVGLAGNKRVILAVARGGYYGPGSPVASFEHAETYLRSCFAFMGIHSPEVVIAEGLAVGPDQRNAAIAAAEERIGSIVV
jgi:FMN-dependent NADH-azoreductase